MYEQVFNFNSRPFTTTPYVNHYFAASAMHQAVGQASICIERGSGPVIGIGGVGTGKSLLLAMLNQLFKERFKVVTVTCARNIQRRDFLQSILFQLGQPATADGDSELRFAILNAARRSATCEHGILLLVDDADLLTTDTFDELRLLMSFVEDGAPRIRIVLAGQKSLEDRLAVPELASFSQCIACRVFLQNLNRDETNRYVIEHIDRVGGPGETMFPSQTTEKIHELTDGCPRLINQISDFVLILAGTRGVNTVSPDLIVEAWNDVQSLSGSEVNFEPSAMNNHRPDADDDWTVIEFGQLDDEDALDTAAPNIELSAAPLAESDLPAEPTLSAASAAASHDSPGTSVDPGLGVDIAALEALQNQQNVAQNPPTDVAGPSAPDSQDQSNSQSVQSSTTPDDDLTAQLAAIFGQAPASKSAPADVPVAAEQPPTDPLPAGQPFSDPAAIPVQHTPTPDILTDAPVVDVPNQPMLDPLVAPAQPAAIASAAPIVPADDSQESSAGVAAALAKFAPTADDSSDQSIDQDVDTFKPAFDVITAADQGPESVGSPVEVPLADANALEITPEPTPMIDDPADLLEQQLAALRSELLANQPSPTSEAGPTTEAVPPSETPPTGPVNQPAANPTDIGAAGFAAAGFAAAAASAHVNDTGQPPTPVVPEIETPQATEQPSFAADNFGSQGLDDPFAESFEQEELIDEQFGVQIAAQNQNALEISSADLQHVQPVFDLAETNTTDQVVPTKAIAPASPPSLETTVVPAEPDSSALPTAPSTPSEPVDSQSQPNIPAGVQWTIPDTTTEDQSAPSNPAAETHLDPTAPAATSGNVATESNTAPMPPRRGFTVLPPDGFQPEPKTPTPSQDVPAATPQPGLGQLNTIAPVPSAPAPIQAVAPSENATPGGYQHQNDVSSDDISRQADEILRRLQSTTSPQPEANEAVAPQIPPASAPVQPVAGTAPVAITPPPAESVYLGQDQQVLDEIRQQQQFVSSTHQAADPDQPPVTSPDNASPATVPMVPPHSDDSEVIMVHQSIESAPPTNDPPDPESTTVDDLMSTGNARRMEYEQLFDRLRNLPNNDEPPQS